MTSRSLDDNLHDLTELSRDQLVGSWQSLLRCDPPKGISTRLMVRAIAYEMQAKHYDALKPYLIGRLYKIAAGKPGEAHGNVPAAPKLEPGARLVREWNGVTHTVDVTDLGLEWRGKRYGSLSEIAREITGARWSGPRFFGLNRRAAP